MSTKQVNGRYILSPQPKRLGNLSAGIQPDEAVTKAQLDAVQNGTVDLARVELSADGTAAAPAVTWNGDADTGIYRIGDNNIGVSANGAKVLDIATTGLGITGVATVSSTTDSTSKDTGAIITEGGIGAEKAIFAGTTINAGTSITVGTDVIGAKEVDHLLTVAATTTAATAGGKVTVRGGVGATSGAGGAAEVIGGAAGATAGAAGGAVNIIGGAEGAGGGIGGNVNITPGLASSSTVSPLTIVNKGKAWKPLTGTVATGATATGVQVANGLLTITGATGNVTLPTAAQITTAVGATPAGTVIDFVVNAVGMTATNTVTLVVGANMTVMSAPPITGGGTLTVTQDTQVVGYFRLIYHTATDCKIMRIA